MDPSRRFFRGGPLPSPRPRSEFAYFTPPAAEPLARLQMNRPISGQFICATRHLAVAPRLHFLARSTDWNERSFHMDAATWLRQMAGESAQPDKRAQLTELCAYLAGLPSLDNLLFEGMERVATFFAAERAAVFIPDRENQLRAVAWVVDSVRELRLQSEPGNLVGWAAAASAPASVRNVWDLAELVRLHPRLRPDERLDQWLGLRLRAVMLAPLRDGEHF